MATEGPNIHDGSQTQAASDLSAKQFYGVKITAARQVDLANTGGEGIYGVLQNKPTANQAADVVIFGVTKCAAGAALSAGDLLMTDSTGRFITATSTNHAVGIALEGAGAAAVIFTAAIGIGGLGVGKVL